MSGHWNNPPDAGRVTPAYVATPAIDTELRGFGAAAGQDRTIR
jgi:hypothetical protein